MQLHVQPVQADSPTEGFTTITSAEGNIVRVPESFLCPITMNLMVRPLVNRNGHTFEQEAIQAWLKKTGECHLTRQPMSPSNFYRDANLELKIKNFRQQNEIPATDEVYSILDPEELVAGFVMTVDGEDPEEHEKDEAEEEKEENTDAVVVRKTTIFSQFARRMRSKRRGCQ